MSAGEVQDIAWHPPGPVAAACMRSDAMLRVLQGPVGSAKTSWMLMEPMLRAARQRRSPIDGNRYYTHTVVRDTYRQLWRATIPTWREWVPQGVGEWAGGYDQPATHLIRIPMPDGGTVLYTVNFVAIGDNAVEQVLRGYPSTSFGLDEGDLLHKAVIDYCVTRAGRTPPRRHGGPTWRGILVACNAPIIDTDLQRRIRDELEPGVEYFKQPPGLVPDGAGGWVANPEAENIGNLPDGYYEQMIGKLDDQDFKRLVLNEFGYRRDGKPVYAEFNEARHVARRPLEPDPHLPLLLGVDGGKATLNPAAVIGQRTYRGQWRILDEVICEHGTGLERFADEINRLLRARYPGWKQIDGWVDPSALFGADDKAGEQDWLVMFRQKTGIRLRAAPGNNRLAPRLEAVRRVLTHDIEREPSLVVSPRCGVLISGFVAGYRYRKVNVQAEDRYVEEPEKNEYSHPHDGLQYLLLGGGEYDEVMERRERRSAKGPVEVITARGTRRAPRARRGGRV